MEKKPQKTTLNQLVKPSFYTQTGLLISWLLIGKEMF